MFLSRKYIIIILFIFSNIYSFGQVSQYIETGVYPRGRFPFKVEYSIFKNKFGLYTGYTNTARNYITYFDATGPDSYERYNNLYLGIAYRKNNSKKITFLPSLDIMYSCSKFVKFNRYYPELLINSIGPRLVFDLNYSINHTFSCGLEFPFSYSYVYPKNKIFNSQFGFDLPYLILKIKLYEKN